MYSGAVVKVCADSQQNNKKRLFFTLNFKMGDFANVDLVRLLPVRWHVDQAWCGGGSGRADGAESNVPVVGLKIT